MNLPSLQSSLTMQGAEPFFIPGGDTGCLLIHGYTGTPFEMRMLGDFLAQAGFSILAPRLSGHATQPVDMTRCRWQDWQASVEDGLNLLRGCTKQQVVMGLSLGGVLALLTAARFPVSGVVSFSAPGVLPLDPRMKWVPAIYRIYPMLHKGVPDWHNPDAALDHKEYRSYPTRSLIELDKVVVTMRAELGNVTAPVLFVQSHQDKVISPDCMDYLYDHVGSKDKSRLWVEDSGHVVIREPERERVFLEVQKFLQRILINP